MIDPPKTQYWCEACGTIENGRHNSIVCRFLLWIDKLFGVEE